MDKDSIYLHIEGKYFEFNADNYEDMEVFYLITEGNPGAVTVLLNIYKIKQSDEIIDFLNKIWKKSIIGSRLWYIYKNECNNNVNELLSKDLSLFTNDYFYQKFEKYTKV